MDEQETVPEELQASEAPEFPCDGCGATLRWDPAEDALSCEFCGNVSAVPRATERIIERGLDEAPSARGFGLELRVTNCDNCGARVTFEGTETADACVYCGSANVLSQEANRNAIRPESLVPLDVSKEEVAANFERWRRGLWFRPNALKHLRKFEAVGLYVPYWTFDAQVHSDWSADSGTYYYVTETYTTQVNGKTVTRTRQVRKTRWRPAWGSRDDTYDDWLVPASKGLDAGHLEDLGDFDTTVLVPYAPQYLAGWRAEEYSIDLEDGWGLGRDGIVGSQHSRCAGDIPGDTYRNLSVQNDIGGVRWKHVLLPIWSLQYRFKGEVYTVLVHGQSGRVVGDAPFSWVKILVAVLGVLAVIAVVMAVAAAQ
jgi:hypothetical protein